MGFGGAWFLCKYANRTASRESLFSRFDTWLQYTENKGFEQNKFYKRIIERGPRDRRYFKPARVEVKNWSGKYINRSALNWDRTQDAAETRRSTVSLILGPITRWIISSVPLDIFSVNELNLMNYLHCVTAILCSYFCPPPPHSPTTLQCNTLTDNLNEFDSKIWLLFQKSRHGSCHNETCFNREIFKTFQCSYSTWETEAVSRTRLTQGSVYCHLL